MSSRQQSSIWLTRFQQQRGKSSLREQLCSTLRNAIAQGQLVLGARLPASRVLAADLRLSRVTVEAAYAQLEAEGYVSRKVGVGTVVSIQMQGTPAKAAFSSTGAPLSVRGRRIVAGGACNEPQQVQAFAAGCPDLRAFPLDTWRSLTARRLRLDGSSLFGYGDPQGYAPLRQAIAVYLNQARGVRCDAGQVLILTSSQQALHLLASLLLDPGDTVWMEEPGYRAAKTAFASVGAQLVPVPVDSDGMDMCALKHVGPGAPRLIYCTPSHQYPTGVSLSLTRRLALIEFARQHQSWLIEDDYDSEFEYDGHAMPAMQGLDEHGRVIYLGTFSKVLFPSLRLAYVVLPPELVDACCRARSIFDGHSAQLMQAVTADFIQDGHFARHIRQMRLLYGSRRDLLLQQIRQKLGGLLFPAVANGGLQLATWFDSDQSDGSTTPLPTDYEGSLSAAAAALGVATPGISSLYLGPPIRQGWLLGYAALRNEEIISSVNQLLNLI